MRIISEFKDYYDCVQAMGQDQSRVYLRKPSSHTYKYDSKRGRFSYFYNITGSKIEEEKIYPFPSCGCEVTTKYSCNTTARMQARPYVVGFCGKVYGVIEANIFKEPREKSNGELHNWHFYDIEKIDKWVEKNFAKNEVKEYFSQDSYSYKHAGRRKWGPGQRRRSFEAFFKVCKEEQDNFSNIFIDNKCPQFVAGPHKKIVYNACLKDCGFYQVFDSYQAFQEIEMYMSNTLLLTDGHKPKYQGKLIEPEFDDVTKRDSKGFDNKSFKTRNHPSKPRKGKKNK